MKENYLVQTIKGVTIVTGIREEVLNFALIMEQKLKENNNKGGWKQCELKWLLKRIKDETGELKRKIEKYSQIGSRRACADDSIGNIGEPEPIDIQREAADIANFAMMISDNVNSSQKGD